MGWRTFGSVVSCICGHFTVVNHLHIRNAHTTGDDDKLLVSAQYWLLFSFDRIIAIHVRKDSEKKSELTT